MDAGDVEKLRNLLQALKEVGSSLTIGVAQAQGLLRTAELVLGRMETLLAGADAPDPPR